MYSVAVEAINSAQRIGEEQLQAFVKECLIERSKAIDVIHHNKIFNAIQTSASKIKLQVASLKCDIELFSRLYNGCCTREGKNLEYFFIMKIKLIHQHCLMVVSYI